MPPRHPRPSHLTFFPQRLFPSFPFLLPHPNPHPHPFHPPHTRTIQSLIQPSRPNSAFNKGPSIPILGSTPAAALERKARHLPPRTGVLAIKKGMTAVYDEVTGVRTPCTVVQLDRVQVVGHKTREQHGYFAVQVGYGWRHPENVTRPMLGHYERQGVSPKKWVVEFRVRDETGLKKVGEELRAGWLREGQFVDAKSLAKGKGFAGGMKRHGFAGQPASHGASKVHRAMGSAGQSQGGGSRVYPGKKMAGRMGGEQVTIQNVKVLKVDEEHGIVLLHGCIAGPNGGLVKLQDARKKPWPDIPQTIPTKETVVDGTSVGGPTATTA
ncbi:MAG: 54S ribosomal protein L9, mitochondrial [Peltula sp. TS41687]|nr:MAG: 54S ribosomal protein L9, mitochondrial [Peltula sp. TS41687]